MSDLFAQSSQGETTLQAANDGTKGHGELRPLAEVLRPKELADVIGQEHLTGSEGRITKMLHVHSSISSMIFWGPPGTGKTTLARLLAHHISGHYVTVSAIHSKVEDLRRIFEEARRAFHNGQRTVLFVDEIHRFNRAQQDSFLPVVEEGIITLIGATTENPSFSLNSALLSRMQVLVFKPLTDAHLGALVKQGLKTLGLDHALDEGAMAALVAMADGDARSLYVRLESVLRQYALYPVLEGKEHHNITLTRENILSALDARLPNYDRDRDGHYNMISALHKSIRGSDPDAALYYFYRMLDAGEAPLYIARRLVRAAVEDIGLADPTQLTFALSAKEAFELQGSPEGDLALAACVVSLAMAPKSNAVYKASKAAQGFARKYGSVSPPKHILNAPTQLMKEQGYGAGYHYDHDYPGAISGQRFLPDDVPDVQFYEPTIYGAERELSQRLEKIHALRMKRRNQK